VQVHLQSSDLSKIRAKSLKIWAKWGLTLFDSAPNISRKTHEDIFWRSYQKKVYMISDLCKEIL